MSDKPDVCPKCGAKFSHKTEPNYHESVYECSSRGTYQSERCKLLALQAALAEKERELGDYKAGAIRNTATFTEIGNALGLEGTMFREFGKHHIREALSKVITASQAAEQRVEELTAARERLAEVLKGGAW